MKERPIIFSGPMVRAILEGRKTQTRRVIKEPLSDMLDDAERAGCAPMVDRADKVERTGESQIGRPERMVGTMCTVNDGPTIANITSACPYNVDRLWVRETWAPVISVGCAYVTMDGPGDDAQKVAIKYRADGDDGVDRWKPSIHMPRWASRIALEITDVRAERVQEISEEDANAEGLSASQVDDGATLQRYSARRHFRALWDSINAKRPGCSWADNPWAWCLTFQKVDQ